MGGGSINWYFSKFLTNALETVRSTYSVCLMPGWPLWLDKVHPSPKSCLLGDTALAQYGGSTASLTRSNHCCGTLVRLSGSVMFCPMRYFWLQAERRFGVYAFHVLLILVYAICWCARRCFVIFGCRIIPVHGFRYRAMWLCSCSLDSAVTPLYDAVTFWDISTQVSHSSVQAKKVWLQKAGALSVFQLARHVQRRPTSVLTLWLTHPDVPASATQWNVLVCSWSVSRIHCHRNGLYLYQAYTSCFPTSILPFSHWAGAGSIDWQSLQVLYYWSDYCFCGRGAYLMAEIGCTSDARMSTLSMYGSDLFRC